MNANEPVAWGFKDFEGNINDCICPEEHDRAEGDYTIPLYLHPVNVTYELTMEKCRQQQAEIEALKAELNKWMDGDYVMSARGNRNEQ